MTDDIDNNQDSYDLYDECDNSHQTCDCFECKVYLNTDTKRPIKAAEITDETFNELLTLCQREDVIEQMKSERYRSNIYQIVPYPMWKELQDPEKYQAIADKLKNKLPNDLPEICFIGSAIHNTQEINTIMYRFPTSTVKYELLVYKEDGQFNVKTHSTGSEY